MRTTAVATRMAAVMARPLTRWLGTVEVEVAEGCASSALVGPGGGGCEPAKEVKDGGGSEMGDDLGGAVGTGVGDEEVDPVPDICLNVGDRLVMKLCCIVVSAQASGIRSRLLQSRKKDRTYGTSADTEGGPAPELAKQGQICPWL